MARRVKPGRTEPEEFDEGPSESDLEAFSGVTRTCPECKAELFDDTAVCWKCGRALDESSPGKPGWVVVLAVVIAAALLVFLLRW